MKIRVTHDTPEMVLAAHPDAVVFSGTGATVFVVGARDVRSARVALHAHDPQLSQLCTDVHTLAVPYARPPQAGRYATAA